MKEDNNQSAFNELYGRYWKVIYQVGLKNLEDEDLAEDLVHDIFVDLWIRRADLEIHTTFAGYIHTCLKNRLVDEYRKDSYRRKVHAEIRRNSSDGSDQLFEDFACADLEQRLMLEVDRFPSGMRQIFLLSRQEQLSPSEIAEKLSLSVQTVKNQIGGAVKRLRMKGLHS